MARGKGSGRFRRFLILLVLAAIAWAAIGVFRTGSEPTVALRIGSAGGDADGAGGTIGRSAPTTIEVAEPKRGVTTVLVELSQGARTETVYEQSFEPLGPDRFWGDRTAEHRAEIDLGKDTAPWLEEGKATVRLTAGRASSWLRSPDPVVVEHEVTVKLIPPTLAVTSSNTFVTQGGAEAVVYVVGADTVRHGVQAGDWFFPGEAVPGATDGSQFVFFAAPYDLDDDNAIRLIAEDAVGNRAETAFIDRFSRRPPTRDTIRLSDGFLSKVVAPILTQTPELTNLGSDLDNYLQINRALRATNNATLVELSEKSTDAFLWKGRFLSLPNSAVKSTFADRRTYVYEGRDVDKQDHLGYDLASVARAEIPASNSGIVVLARYFGIYGNAVVIDHGYGLMTLYGHLSSIAVAEGDAVERGQTIGRTGATGLAGGDHLHFTTMLRGLAVDPKEWWDAHWLRDRIGLKLGDAAPL